MRPLIRVTLDGQDISSRLKGRILSGEIVENDGGRADELALVISNHDGQLAKPKRGAVLSVELGFEASGLGKVGSFKVQEVVKIGAAASFEVRALAADFKKSLKQQKTRSWIKKTLGDALRQIAGDNGLQAAIDPELASIAGNFYQTGVSDIHFVTAQARKYGAIGKVAEGRLVFAKKGEGQTAGGADMGSISISPNDLEGDFRMSDKDRPNRGKVKAAHHDRDTGKREEIVEGEGDGPEYVFPQAFGSKAEAKAAVRGRKREFDAAGKAFSGTLRSGRNDLKAGGRISTTGFGDDDDTTWVAARVVHQFSDAGYITRFEAKLKTKQGKAASAPAATPTPPAASAATAAETTPGASTITYADLTSLTGIAYIPASVTRVTVQAIAPSPTPAVPLDFVRGTASRPNIYGEKLIGGVWWLPVYSSDRISFVEHGGRMAPPGVVGPDNAAVLNQMGIVARAICAAGGTAKMLFEPGQWDYDLSKCLYWLQNIPRLELSGYGSSARNIYSGPPNFWFDIAWAGAQPPLDPSANLKSPAASEGDLIYETTPGQDFVQLVIPENPPAMFDPSKQIWFDGPLGIDGYKVGDTLLTGSGSVQPAGSPPNHYRHEPPKITSIDKPAGKLFLDRPVKHRHMQSYPDIWYPWPVNTGSPQGRARIWNLDRYSSYDVDHLYKGLTIRPNVMARANADYVFSCGRRIRFVDCTLSGYGPTMNEYWELSNTTVTGFGEIDKNIGQAVLKGVTFASGVNFASPADLLLAEDCNFLLSPGQFTSLQAGAKKQVIKRGFIQSLALESPIGFAEETELEDVHIATIHGGLKGFAFKSSLPFGTDASGATFSYANGVFTVANFGQSIIDNQNFNFNCIPGALINLSGPVDGGTGQPIYTGPAGDCRILSLSQAGTDIAPTLVITTDRVGALPAWATGARIGRLGALVVRNCTGAADIVAASRAYLLGRNPWSFFHWPLEGAVVQTAGWLAVGRPTEIIVDVTAAGPAASTLQLQFYCYDSANLAAAPKVLRLTINLAVAGPRTVTSASAALQSGDTLTFDNTATTHIPLTAWLSNSIFRIFSYDPAVNPQAALSVQLTTDIGAFGTLLNSGVIQGAEN